MSLRLAVGGVIALLSCACWVPVEQGQAMESDIVKLKAELADQRRVLDENGVRADRERDRLKAEQDASIKKVDAKIREVTETLEKLNHAARKTGADLGVQLDEATREVARLRGLFEEVQAKQTAFDAAKAELDGKLLELDARLKGMEETRKAADAAAEAKAAERPASKEGFYGLAREKLEKGEHETARKLFTEYLTKWPEDALSSNCQYWLGESFYAEKKYREAILEFRKVGEKFAKSDKAPDALLKIGYSFAALGLADEAKLFLDEVVRSHPKSGAAKLAKTKLKELGK